MPRDGAHAQRELALGELTGGGVSIPPQIFRVGFLEMDPPEFRSYRKVVNPIASPAAVDKINDMIVQWTTWFIDELIEAGEADLAQVIGVPAIPITSLIAIGAPYSGARGGASAAASASSARTVM